MENGWVVYIKDMSNKKLVLIDGYSFFFRAYYAIKNIKRRSDGMAVNGVYGFTRMLMNVIVDMNSTHIGVVFDTGEKTLRHEKYPEYKANRPPVPDDMVPQFPLIREVTKSLNIVTVEKSGYEADDIIATLAKQAKREGFEVWIISCDKDLMQLVDNNIFLYDTKESKKITADDIKQKWGVEPKKLLDILALMGDSSDNVPGVAGIGPKTAVELVNEYGSVDEIIKNLDSIKQEKRRNLIKNNINNLKLSKELVTLVDDVDLGISIDDLSFKNFNPIKFKDFLYEMEFNSIAREIEKKFIDNSHDEYTKVSKNYEYKKITDILLLKSVVADIINQNTELFFAILTNKIDDCADIKHIIFSDKRKKNIYHIHFNEENQNLSDFFTAASPVSNLTENDVFSELSALFEDEKLKKITYNTKKQIRLLLKYNIKVCNYEDIGLMSYIIDNGKFNQNFYNLIIKYLLNNIELKIEGIDKLLDVAEKYEKGKDLVSLVTGNDFNFYCLIIEAVEHLYQLIVGRITDDTKLKKLYDDVEKPLLEVLANMEYDGVKIDINELGKLNDFFNDKLKAVENKIYDTVGFVFNLNSPKQIGEILFEKMNLPMAKKSRKSGYYSTDIEILDELYKSGFEIAGDILEYRHYTKLKNTYTDVLPKLIDKNNRVHTNYSNTFVITGRLSSSNPNLQNIPIRTEDGEKIRKTFISKHGYSLIGADYSQIELRILAQYADVKKLKENFLKGLDIHSETAKKVFKTNDVTADMRRMAKAINFSIVYGTTSFGLAKRLDMSNVEAKNYMDNYFQLYPEVKEYMENMKDFAKKNGYVETMYGRKCYIDLNSVKEPQKSFLERLAINAPIQGTGADVIKMAMNKLFKTLKGFDAKIILQVHDELLIEVLDNQVDEVKGLVKNVMENVVKFDIPLLVDVKVGKNWAEVH